MTHFTENLNHLLAQTRPATVKALSAKVGIARTVLSRLLNGTREPTAGHLALLAQYVGTLAPEDFLKDPAEFKRLVERGHPPGNSPLHTLSVLAKNLPRCAAMLPVYEGQYVLYAPSSRPETVVASLLEIKGLSRNGIGVTITNPYNGHDGAYLAFEYTGFMIPISEYVYIFAEQQTGDYEVTTLILHGVPVPPAQILEGVWSGIGVKRNRKFVSSSPCVALRTRKHIGDWRSALDEQLGYLPIGKLPEVVRLKMQQAGILITS